MNLSRRGRILLLMICALAMLPATSAGAGGEDPTLLEAVASPASRAAPWSAWQASGPVLPLSLDAEVSVHPDWSRLQVEARLSFRAETDSEVVEFLLRPEVELGTVEDANGLPLAYERIAEAVLIHCPTLVPGATEVWSFKYSVRLSRPLAELDGFYTANPWYPYVSSPNEDDEFLRSVPIVARISVRVPDPWVAISSGHLSVAEDSERDRYVWTQARPSPFHPLIVGRFRRLEIRSGGVLGRGFFSEEHAEIGEEFVRTSLAIIEFYARTIGSYDRADFSIVEAVLPSRLHGLTLPGLTIVSTEDVDRSSPFPYRILAHEIAHNWWSILVEFPRRTDYWLREGLPTYSALMFLESTYGAEAMRQELSRSRSIALGAEEPQPLTLGIDMQDGASSYALNYHKAAFVLHMLRNLLGRERFVELLRQFSTTYSDSSASTQDFRRMAEEVYGGSLEWFFAGWIEAAEIPRFELRYEILENADVTTPTHQIVGTLQQHDASIEGPALLRIRLVGAPPLEHVVWLEAGTTRFSVICPAPPESLEFDPHGDLLYSIATIEQMETGRPRPRRSTPESSRARDTGRPR